MKDGRTEKNFATEFHADDYGLFPEQSERILACAREGVLDGVSVMPNSPYLAESMEKLAPFRNRVRVAVHLNLIEGRALCPHDRVPLLTDREGIFRTSFGKLLAVSCIPGIRRRYRRQIAREFAAQIRRVHAFCAEDALRLDSHTHLHMVPVVFDAMMDAVKLCRCDVGYIRIPGEKPALYFAGGLRPGEIRPVNVLKTAVLKVLSVRAEMKYRRHPVFLKMAEGRENAGNPVFAGVLCSGEMNQRTVRALLRGMRRLLSPGTAIEILFHPGGVYEAQDIKALTFAGDRTFLTNRAAREAEAEALRAVGRAAGRGTHGGERSETDGARPEGGRRG